MPAHQNLLRFAEHGEQFSGYLAIAGCTGTVICLALMVIFDKDQERKGRVKELDIATGIFAGTALLSCFSCVCCFSRCVNKLLPKRGQPSSTSAAWRAAAAPLVPGEHPQYGGTAVGTVSVDSGPGSNGLHTIDLGT